MKRFSLFLMIVLLVSAIFISCSAEPTSDSGVANIAVSISSEKGLSARADVENLPDAEDLVWTYEATKALNDNSTTSYGFKTGETSGETLIRADGASGLPQVIGQTGIVDDKPISETWFSIGNWTFSFYGYKDYGTTDQVRVYKAVGVPVKVLAATTEDPIGGNANITLTIDTNPLSDSTVETGNIYVDLSNGFEDVSYKMYVYVDDSDTAITSVTGSNSVSEKRVYFASTTIATYTTDFGFHNYYFVVKKTNANDETVYASGSIENILVKKGCTWTISGDLDNLDSWGQVAIHYSAGIVENSKTTVTVGTKAQLKAIATLVNAGDSCKDLIIKLTNDITLTEPWTPIGNSYRGQENGAYFAGTFDGQDHTISGLRNSGSSEGLAFDNDNEYVFGLFGVVKNATIKNLTMLDVQINQVTGLLGENVAAVVGYSEGSLTLENITVGAQNDSTSYIKGQHVAGVISRAYGKSEGATITISNCTNYVNITATNGSDDKAKAAGIAAYVSGQGARVTIEDCKNYGALSSSATTNAIAAGIVNYGFNDNYKDTYTVTGNDNRGNITLSGAGFLYAQVSGECNNGLKSSQGDTIVASGNSSVCTVTVNDSGVSNVPLVRSSQGGPEVNSNN